MVHRVLTNKKQKNKTKSLKILLCIKNSLNFEELDPDLFFPVRIQDWYLNPDPDPHQN